MNARTNVAFWKEQSNAAVHGAAYAVKRAAARMPFAIAMHAVFGRFREVRTTEAQRADALHALVAVMRNRRQHAERLQYEPMRTFIIDQPIRTVDLKRFGF